MGRQQVMKLVLRGGLLLILVGLTSCSPLDLLDAIKGLAARDALGPIQEVYIDAGGDSFTMGESAMGAPESTQAITNSFYMSKYEITNAQYKQFMDDGGYTTKSYWTTNGWIWRTTSMGAPPVVQPANWNNSSFNGSKQPVTGASWWEAVAFCNWRSAKEYLTPAYDANGKADLAASGYRLPTEVEWEYAAAKGAPGQAERSYPFGNSPDTTKVTMMRMFPADVGDRSASGGDTPQGLADMCGNAPEWCSDNYDSSGPVQSGTDRYHFVGDDYGASNYQAAIRGGGYSDSTMSPVMACAYPSFRFMYDVAAASNPGFRTVRP
jgi:iron(II)-dependent oxidoreductase